MGEFVPFIWLWDGQLFPHIIHPHLALVVSSSYMEAALGPGDSVERSPSLHRYTGASDLSVLVKIPEVQSASAVHCGEESWMLGRPSTVVHIVTCTVS